MHCRRPKDDRSWRHRGEELLAGDVLECFPVTKWDRKLGRPVPVTSEEGRVLDQWDRKDDVARQRADDLVRAAAAIAGEPPPERLEPLLRDVGPMSVAPIAGSEKRDSVAPPGADNPGPRDESSGPIIAPPSDRAGDAIATENAKVGASYEALISSASSHFNLKREVVEAIAARTCRWISPSAYGRGLEEGTLELALVPAREVMRLLVSVHETHVTNVQMTLSPAAIVRGAPSTAAAVLREAAGLANVVPLLVAEIKRLRGWS